MMQRWCSRLRQFAALHSIPKQHHRHRLCRHSFVSDRLLYTSPNLLHKPHTVTHSLVSPNFKSLLNASSFPHFPNSPLSVSTNFTCPFYFLYFIF
ncbi:hypothetical protein CDL12_28297 [Handroanthus impetiginosus]|uniref:Uncharacterized protein n=1 Tax=Handroanthus impetiginosus TaxID=429701 RepID=A0A2G9G1X8_9LAMI|nr:hypothetical protein CDL12_28297 [Handroanthus impetiginosus]